MTTNDLALAPDACTLPTSERPLRLAEFDDLFATAVRRVESVTPTHVRLHLSGPAGLEDTVRDLTARETECCSFFTFTVTPELLDVRVPEQYVEVLDALTRRAVTVRRDAVQARIAELQAQATRHGPGTPEWVEAIQAMVDAASLSDDRYQFPVVAGDDALVCDLAADGGEARDRIGVWQQVFARVQGRDPLEDTETGLALRFPLEADLAATLARLAADEYRCCSFGSYTLVIDDTGLRLEIRMPAGASAMLAAVAGVAE